MRFLYYFTWPYLFFDAQAALFENNLVNGRTRLVGTSFGILGINATFDYVVSRLFSVVEPWGTTEPKREGTMIAQIIGGGTSGLTVAKRLAEDSKVSVAVIEGGSFYEIDNGNRSQIPAYDAYNTSPSPSSIQPLIDWGIVSVPQPQLDGREVFYPQGKCLGGSSARNYLAYQRGTVGTYKQWADAVGDESYTFDNILPYFKKSVAFTLPNYAKRGAGGPVALNASAFSSLGGPLQVSYSNFWQPMTDYVRTAFTKLGLKAILGFNSGQLLGFSEFTSTVDPHQIRSSSETSFLQAAVESSTLQVYQQTLAKKILFGANKSATGVSVVTGGKPYTLSARREVILAAGVFRSPHLLMVSGIGPAATLAQFNIPVLSDLQGVGQKLRDHPFYGVSYRVNVTTQSQLNANATFVALATEAYLQSQTGPLTTAGGTLVGFEKLPMPLRSQLSDETLSALSSFPADWPELELLPLASTTAATNDSQNYASFSVAVLTPTSRGNVTIGSSDTSDNPIISPNWLSTSSDRELAVQGLKRARQVAAATGITVGPEYSPGFSAQSDEQILNYIKQTVAPFHHASSTCAMGKAGDRNAVVDSSGKVFGVKRLRIVDASTFPFLPPGHVQSSVYMLAEKLADDIKRQK